MARKNRKSKFKSMHQKDLKKNKEDLGDLELNLEKLKQKTNQVEEVDMGADNSDVENADAMEIEGQSRRNKIRKNKLFQKRAIIEEKNRLKRYKRAPVLISSKRMQIE